MITLTFGPGIRERAEQRALARGCIEGSERFVALQRELGRHVTMYLKRVRERSQAPLRLAVVTEPHKDGFPHFHVLLHEQGQEVRWSLLSDEWFGKGLGFCVVKLVDNDSPRAAFYVAKYCAKAQAGARARVRASIGYGRGEDQKGGETSPDTRRVKRPSV